MARFKKKQGVMDLLKLPKPSSPAMAAVRISTNMQTYMISIILWEAATFSKTSQTND